MSKECYAVVERNTKYDDMSYTVLDGYEVYDNKVYESYDDAKKVCDELNEIFFKDELPEDWYLPDGWSRASTWEEAKLKGFVTKYEVITLYKG